MDIDVMIIIWLAAVVASIVLEAATAQFVCIWFGASALIALVSALFSAPAWLQITVFIVCTGVLLVFTRPIVKKLMKKGKTSTNADRAIGMTAIVLEEIDNDAPRGLVKVNNQTWSARSVSGEVIPEGTHVTVRAIEGVKLMVEEAVHTIIKGEVQWN